MSAPLRLLPATTAPPQDEATERAILGGLLLDCGYMPAAMEALTAEHFGGDRHRTLWAAYLDAWEEHGSLDLLTVRATLERRGELDAVGGIAYLAGLDLDLPDLSRWETYADVLEERRVRRTMDEAGHRLIRNCRDGSEDSRVLLAAEQEALLRAGRDRGQSGFASAAAAMAGARERLAVPAGETSGITTGFPDLDRSLMGWEAGQLVYLAGRPGMGKSALVMQMAVAAAKAGHAVGVFSLEMTRDDLALRMLSAETGIAFGRIRKRHLHDVERKRLAEASAHLAGLRFSIDDTAAVTSQLLSARAMRLQREKGLDLLVVDYVGLLTPGERYSSANEGLTVISRGLKILAKRLEVPIIAAAQLSRALEQRGDKRPILSDLRDSGSLEQDADVVLFVYRPGYYSPDADPTEGAPAEVIVAKQRNGPTGIVSLVWQGDRVRFQSAARGER